MPPLDGVDASDTIDTDANKTYLPTSSYSFRPLNDPYFNTFFQSKLKVSPQDEEKSSEKGPLTTGAPTGAAGSDKPGSSTTAQPNKMMSAARQLSKGNLGNRVDQNYGNILINENSSFSTLDSIIASQNFAIVIVAVKPYY